MSIEDRIAELRSGAQNAKFVTGGNCTCGACTFAGEIAMQIVDETDGPAHAVKVAHRILGMVVGNLTPEANIERVLEKAFNQVYFSAKLHAVEVRKLRDEG